MYRSNLLGYFIDRAQLCVEALDSSQRAIFVLTEDIFEEEWNIYALDVALKEHRKIIIIKRQEVNFQTLLGKCAAR